MRLINSTPFPNIFQKVAQEDKNYLFQGDIIRECELISTPSTKHLGYLIVSNSCDLRRLDRKTAISLVPIYPFEYLLNKFIKTVTKKVISQKKRDEREGKDYDVESALCSEVAGLIFSEANYERKYTFFISPLEQLGNLPSIAFIEDVKSINKEYTERLLEHRIVSLKSPWKEKLGYMVGNLYNRVATYSPRTSAIKDWWKVAYEREYQEALHYCIDSQSIV